MNILFLVDYDITTSGGVQTSVRAQRDELRRQGHQVVLLCPGQDRTSDEPVDGIHFLPSLPFFRPNGVAVASPWLNTTQRILNKLRGYESFDIVHCQTNSILSYCAPTLARHYGAPLVQTMHGRDDVFIQETIAFPYLPSLALLGYDRLRADVRPKVAKSAELSPTALHMWQIMLSRAAVADAVTIPSHHLTELFIHHGLDRKSVTTISNGLSDTAVDAALKTAGSRSLHLPIRLMWAGRVSEEKQPLLFLEMLTQLDVPFEATLYGEGEQLSQCRSYVASHGLADRVTLHGKYQASKAISHMQQHDLLVYTSDGFDNQPMVLLEAVAAGLPVVMCDPNLVECVPTAGAVLSKANASTLAKSVDAITNDEQLYDKLCTAMRAGRDSIRQSTQTTKMLRLYKSLSK